MQQETLSSMMKIPIPEWTRKQKQFIRNATHRWNFKEGAVRSGKTYLDIADTIPKRIRKADVSGTNQIFILGHSRKTIKSNILDPMRKIFGKKLVGEMNSNTGEVTLFGKTVSCYGAEKVTTVDKIHGATVSYCYGDEVATWHPDVFDEIKARLSASGAIFDGTCNPESPNHWLLEFFNSDADVYRQTYLLSDNKEHLDPVYYESIQKEYAGTVYYDRYILGKWVLAEGRVYSNYDPVRDPIDSVPEDLNGNCYVSCDYGTSNPCVFLLWEQGKSGTWYLTKEYYYSGRDSNRQKTDNEYLRDLIKFIGDKNPKQIIIDPSAASFIALVKKTYKVKKARNDVIDGIRFTANVMNLGKLKILKSCRKTIEEISEYCWNDKKQEDVPIKENDHAMDAMRYFAYTIMKKDGKKGITFLT